MSQILIHAGDGPAGRQRMAAARMALPLAAGAFLALTAGTALAQAPEAVAAPAPVMDKGDAAWVMISAVLVMMMTLPGLALFYGGLVRSRNVLSVLMQVLATFSVMAILWVVVGYSLAFTGAGSAEDAGPLTPFIGGLSKMFLNGVTTSSMAESFSAGVFIPEYAFVVFQMAFACIAPALIVGATAERMKFAAILAFVVIWFFLSYLPMAHMSGGGAARRPMTRLRAICSPMARWTSRAAPSSTSTRASRALSPPWSPAPGLATGASRWRPTT